MSQTRAQQRHDRCLHTSHLVVLALALAWWMPTRASSPSASWRDARVVGTLLDPRQDEISGLAVDPDQPQVLWAHNDSGDAARVFRLDPRGRVLSEHALQGVHAIDMEDAAVGPCDPGLARRCLFLADIGDNRHRRPHVMIHRVALPAPERGPLQVERTDYVRYPQGPHDAEALLVHPHTGQVALVLKARRGDSAVLVIPPGPSSPGSPKLARQVATLALPSRLAGGKLVTAADYSPSGRCLSLLTYVQLLTWCDEDPQAPLERRLSAAPDRYTFPSLLQAEAMAYDPATGDLWLTSEGRFAPLLRVSARLAE